MKGSRLNIVGMQFSRLSVLEFSGVTKRNESQFLCRCSCGNEKVIKGTNLKKGITKSCGCLRREKFIEESKKESKRKRELVKQATGKTLKERRKDKTALRRKMFPEKIKQSSKASSKKYAEKIRDELTDTYVCMCLGIKKNRAAQEIIELKREQLLNYRLTRELTNFIKEKSNGS